MRYVVMTTTTVKKPKLKARFSSDDLAEAKGHYNARVFDMREITKRGGVVLVAQSDEGTDVLESTWSNGAPAEIQQAFRSETLPGQPVRDDREVAALVLWGGGD